MRRSKALATMASLCVLLGAAACGGKEQSEDEIVDDLSASLQAGGDDGLSDPEVADCVAEIVVDEIGLDAARDITAADPEPSKAQQKAVATATIRGKDECDSTEEG